MEVGAPRAPGRVGRMFYGGRAVIILQQHDDDVDDVDDDDDDDDVDDDVDNDDVDVDVDLPSKLWLDWQFLRTNILPRPEIYQSLRQEFVGR